MHNGYRDRASFEHLLCQNCEADIDVNIENMSAETGELLVKGRVLALSYTDGVRPTGVLKRLLK